MLQCDEDFSVFSAIETCDIINLWWIKKPTLCFKVNFWVNNKKAFLRILIYLKICNAIQLQFCLHWYLCLKVKKELAILRKTQKSSGNCAKSWLVTSKIQYEMKSSFFNSFKMQCYQILYQNEYNVSISRSSQRENELKRKIAQAYIQSIRSYSMQRFYSWNL